MRKWVRVYVIVLLLSLLITGLGASKPLSKDEASQIIEEFRSQLPEELTALAIFRNNFQVALIMLIPVIGWIIGGLALYNTGILVSAAATTLGVAGSVALLFLLFLPFAPLEFAAYSASLTQSYFLGVGIYRRKIRTQIRKLLFVIMAVAAALLLAAFIEVSFL